MKKMTFLACATLLTSMIALNSCKSDEPGGNPNLNDGDVVKTEFAINLPSQAVGPNKMPAATVQTEGITNFQGMTGITLIPFIDLNANADPITSTSTRLGANIHLSDISAADISKGEGGADKLNGAKVYSDVTIPLSTGSFLFYASSKRNTSNYFSDGFLTADTASSKQPAAFSFSLKPIQSAAEVTAFMSSDGEGGKLLAYLTKVATANDGPSATTPNKYWYQYTTDSLALKNLFDTLTTNMHGVSSFEVERVLTDLYKSLKPIRPVSPMAKAIMDSISLAAYATITNDTVHLVAALANFPGKYALPDGCIDIKWNSTNHIFEQGGYDGMAEPSTFVYPANLWYYANSSIKTANTSKAELYNNTTNRWADILSEYDDATYVNPRTRSVAIKDTIQYAVARFDVAVKLVSGSLADNSDIVEGAAKPVACAAGFPVTAVLIGGQKNVGFDFTQATYDGGDANVYTIYDTIMSSTVADPSSKMIALPGTPSSANHTLLLETGNADVNVAIEMLNTSGVDFYGAGGQLIPKNGKFYVVGKLTSAKRTGTGHADHVFEKDYTTTANMTLKSLRNAYNTIPDLRTPQLELGFAVDLTWQSGNIYNIDIE